MYLVVVTHFINSCSIKILIVFHVNEKIHMNDIFPYMTYVKFSGNDLSLYIYICVCVCPNCRLVWDSKIYPNAM